MRITIAGIGAVLLVAVAAGCGPDATDGPSEAPPEAGLVECFLADYALEPTFERPEDAVADALETDASLGPMPSSPDAYERVERSDGDIEFVFRDGDDHYAVWSTTQDEDGRWGVVSLSACVPDNS